MNCLVEERETMDWPPENPSNVIGLCQTPNIVTASGFGGNVGNSFD